MRSGRSWELNANNSKTVKATDFKFDTCTCSKGQSGHDPQIFSQKGASPRSRDHLNFGALNANIYKTVKATDFKFDTRVPIDSPDVTPKTFPNGGVFNNLLGGDMHSHERLLVIKYTNVILCNVL